MKEITYSIDDVMAILNEYSNIILAEVEDLSPDDVVLENIQEIVNETRNNYIGVVNEDKNHE